MPMLFPISQLFAGLAEDFYGDNLRGASLASRARSKEEVALTPKDMSFHLRKFILPCSIATHAQTKARFAGACRT